MKTFVLVMIMIAVALAAGGSFFVRTEAQEGPGGRLDVDCPLTPLASGVDTLRSCRFVATNTGPSPIVDARLDFAPSANQATPDRYFFVSYRLDGIDGTSSGSQTSYGFGDIAPGRSRTIELDIIVRSTHDFAADAVLSAPAHGEFDRATIASEVIEGGYQPFSATLTLIGPADDEFGPPSVARYNLRTANYAQGEIRRLFAHIAGADGTTVEGLGGEIRYEAGHAIGRLSDLGEGQALKVQMEFTPNQCVYVQPAVVVRGERVLPDGTVEHFAVAALSDESADLGCSPSDGVYALPQGGYGAADAAAPIARSVLLATLVLGAAMVALGVVAQRR